MMKFISKFMLCTFALFLIFINYPFQAKAQNEIAIADSLARQTAEQIIKSGGNAVDAGVAALLTLAVVEPFSTGLGANATFLIFQKDSQFPIVIDSQGAAPLSIDPRLFYRAPGDFDFYTSTGKLAPCVPGILAGAEKAIKKYGALSWEAVAEPAIELAEKGFPASQPFHEMLVKFYDKIMGNSAAFSYFFPEWVPPETGTILTFPDLAGSLKKISESGSAVFYRGSLADRMSRYLQEEHSIIGATDFYNYSSEEKQALAIQFRDLKITAAPLPNVGGLTLLAMMKQMETTTTDSFAIDSGEDIAFFVENYQKAAALVGKFLSGKENISVVEQQAFLDAVKPSQKRKREIDQKFFAPLIFHEGQGAATIAIVDDGKNSVIINVSLNDYFGSKLMVERSGILFNNSMNSFAPLAGVPNSAKPGAKPYSWLTPVIVLQNNRPVLFLGANGASRNIITFARMIYYFHSNKTDPAELAKMPRFHFNLSKNLIEMESRFSAQAMEYLKNRGYDIELKTFYDIYFGNCQLIYWDETQHQYRAVNDVRREGVIYLNH